MVSVETSKEWSAQGSTDASERTYRSVKAALSRSGELNALNIEVFLQGSYANHTNTRGDSDVDVVVMLKSTYTPDTSRLSVTELANYEKHWTPASTSADQLRAMVQRALVAHYGGSRVEAKDKCLKIEGQSGYVDADVVPALQQRLFTSFPSDGRASWVEGTSIKPLSGGRIVNFPKEHRSNGEEKNAASNGYYKPAVRQVKRLRRAAVDQGLLSKKDAPGYLLECLVSNVPDSNFVYGDAERLARVISHLAAFTPSDLKLSMWSGDRVTRLFVDDPGHHDEYLSSRVLKTLEGLL